MVCTEVIVEGETPEKKHCPLQLSQIFTYWIFINKTLADNGKHFYAIESTGGFF